ncbi:MAG: prolyl oligopeptidase family serine peptidase [Pseudomonadota bacterium]
MTKTRKTRLTKRAIAAGALTATVIAATFSGAFADSPEDPYLWLEEVEGESALDWVRSQNDRSQKILEADPRFGPMKADALEILTSDERIPYGQIHAGKVYNFWQDDTNKRGLWRRTDINSYKSGKPKWETVLDFDQLAKDEDRNWIAGDITCLNPDYVHCMIELSDGGKDAGIRREFNTETKEFVENGFFIPLAKSSLSWIDKDTLLVGADWGEGSLTTSGYPRQSRVWRRGVPFEDAPVFYEGEAEDVFIFPYVAQSEESPHVFSIRSTSFFEREYYYDDGDLTKLPLPLNTDIQGVLDGQAIFFLREEWTYNDETFPLGSVVGFDLGDKTAELIASAEPNQSIESVGVGKTSIVIQYLEDVAGKAARLTRNDNKGTWSRKEIKFPANGVVSITSSGGGTDDAMLSFESMTVPDTLFYVEGTKVTKIASTPAFYDSSDVVVDQRFATSADGTKVPYFIMGRVDVLKAGDAPTVQYGYGGFLAPILPVYYSDPGRPQHGALAGKMWINRGGVLVISNIRGGSEYGPAWHQAALKENRQKSFDDFIAISEALIEDGVTSPERLGAVGRSNGGLLMGAIMTQRPDLYAAIDIGVPLFDMKRYNKLLAGASWMGEYGNPDIPEEWAYISQYSPYQKLAADKGYPKVLFYTSTKDDRVHPGHARKAAAKLADLDYDFFYYENIEGGHGGTANQEQLAYRTALEYAYFAHMLMGE